MAKVLTGISGNLISAASAGFAPTNSADVSAIASAYQVVSATATQLYAGTAYVTSVNGAPLSASRAGNAANASLASSAYYDGTGRLISSLPDSAAVSAIASAYAESAASSKQDELTFSYDDDKISAINGSALAGGGGVDSATCSAIASSYAESAVSSKADSSALSSYVPYSSLEYNTASAISGINGSALAAGSTYSAGEGIDITDDVISVEAPVDIVAGPGIVIDNPDGNTLRVSTDENYETVLYSGNAAISNFPITLSEAPANFETVKIYFQPWSDIKTVLEFMGSADRYCLLSSWADGSGNAFYFNQMLLINGLQVSFVKGEYVRFGDNVRNTQTGNFYVFKIVGIHRIQGGS